MNTCINNDHDKGQTAILVKECFIELVRTHGEGQEWEIKSKEIVIT